MCSVSITVPIFLQITLSSAEGWLYNITCVDVCEGYKNVLTLYCKKQRNNPNTLYIVVAERLKLSEAVNLKNSKIDQIYILRKQKKTDRENRF